ncbi:hypothetical protein YZ40_008105, partial [Campylobacter upsaliensis]|nr:hypothetical protein [Campylobacter upsaliensis]
MLLQTILTDLQNENEALNAENERLNLENSNLIIENNKLTQELDSLTSKMKELENINEQLKIWNEQLNKICQEKLDKEITSLDNLASNDLKERLSGLAHTMSLLRLDLINLETKINNANTDETELYEHFRTKLLTEQEELLNEVGIT